MQRALLVLLCLALALGLAACGGPNPEDESDSVTDETTASAEPVIADQRIIGTWDGTDGRVEFREDGTAVLDNGTEVPFTVPQKGRLELLFDSGTSVYTLTWESNDRHGAALVGGQDREPVWYDRVE